MVIWQAPFWNRFVQIPRKRTHLTQLSPENQKRESTFAILSLYYSIRRVELMLGQQSKNQPDEFPSGKSECTFVLMRFHFSILLLIECSEFLAMVLDVARCLKEVIPQIGVSRLGHRRIIGTVIAGLILTPDKTGVFRQRLLRLEGIDPADLRKDSGSHDGAYARYGEQALASCRIKPLERLLNRFVERLDLCRIGRNQVERRSDRNGERLIQALVQAIGIASRFLQERSRRFRVLETVAPLFTDVADECIERHVHDFLSRKEIR